MNAYLIAFSVVLLINLLSFTAYGIDKHRARKDKWRIPESTLLMLAFFGGALGALAGMLVFHHKTRHWKFKILIPLFLLLQLALAVWLAYRSVAQPLV